MNDSEYIDIEQMQAIRTHNARYTKEQLEELIEDTLGNIRYHNGQIIEINSQIQSLSRQRTRHESKRSICEVLLSEYHRELKSRHE